MTEQSGWERFARIDAHERPEPLLGFLDDYAAVAAVQAHKLRATAALRLEPGHRVLDIGCGTGVDLLPLAELVRPGGSVAGVDLSVHAIEAARGRLAGVPDVAVEVADACALPFPDAALAACRLDRTMQHLEHADRALAEFRRVLRPGGRLVILEVLSRIEAPDELRQDGVMRSLLDRRFSAGDRQSWLTPLLPLLVSRVGFAEVALESHETVGGADLLDILLAPGETTEQAIDEGPLSHAELDAWRTRLAEAVAARQVTVTLTGVCLSARAA